jgi:hypothetical protein
MLPCSTTRWFFAFRCVGLNGEPVRPAWALTRFRAVDKWMGRYYAWCAGAAAVSPSHDSGGGGGAGPGPID